MFKSKIYGKNKSKKKNNEHSKIATHYFRITQFPTYISVHLQNARGDRGDQQTLWGPVVNPDVLTDYCNLLLPAGTYTATLVKDAAGVPTLFYVTDHSKGEEVVRLSLTSQVVAQIQCMTSVQQHNRVSVWVGPLRANIIFTAASHVRYYVHHSLCNRIHLCIRLIENKQWNKFQK
jgi:hypothetical protein